MAQNRIPKGKTNSQRSEREQKFIYEQEQEAKLIEDILNEFKNFDENAISDIPTDELDDVEPEYGFEIPDYVKALFAGNEDELDEAPVPTEKDFKLDPKIFEPDEDEPQQESEIVFNAEPEFEPAPEVDFFSELFVKSSPSIDANNELTSSIAVSDVKSALAESEKAKAVAPVITESAGVEITADDYDSAAAELLSSNGNEIKTRHYSFDDNDDEADQADEFSTRALRTEFFTAEFDEKFREMFADSLDNEDKKLGSRKMRSAMATPEELGTTEGAETVQKKAVVKKKKGKGIWIFLLIVFIAVFLYAGYRFGSTYIALSKESAVLDDLANLVSHVESGETGTVSVNGEEIDISTESDGSGRLLQYQQLAAMNKDMIGWLHIPNTVINYPVMYTPDDPEYYIHRDFYGEYSTSGMLFVDANCDIESSDNQIIYGHNMKNDTMFGTLDNYADKDFWEEHQYIYYDSLYEEHVYQVVCVFKSRVLDKDEAGFRYYRFYGSETEEEFNDYVSNIQARQLYDTGTTVSYGDKLITLSTCAYYTEDGRLVVVAKQIS